MDAAEELFARHGIEGASSRQIAELAGQSNHSAVRYHFGTRDDLVRALVLRHRSVTHTRQAEMIAGLNDAADVRTLLACRVMPWMEMMATLPAPSWHARFLAQLYLWPQGRNLLVEIGRSADVVAPVGDLDARIATHLHGIPPTVLRGRADILGHMMLGVCAAYEGDVDSGAKQPNWIGVGNFVIDSSAGMLTAPVTHQSDAPVSAPATFI
ncbi:TetR family transcriptional regulator [Leifsonia kafniensis]